METQNKKFLQVGNFIIVILTIIVNMLAVIVPLNDMTTQDLSDALPNLFVPAGITFSIWSVIYLLLIVFAVYQARGLFSDVELPTPYLEDIHYLFIINGLANMAWIFLWHYQFVALSLIALVVVFGSLMMMYLNLDIGKREVPLTNKLAVHVPISVYFGWSTVALVANVNATLVDLDLVTNNTFLGIAEGIWTIIIIAVVVLITLAVIYDRKDIGYSLVIMWALFGIYLKRIVANAPYGVREDIAYTALLGAVIVGLGLVLRYGQVYFETQKS